MILKHFFLSFSASSTFVNADALIIKLGLSGQLNREEEVTEKTDGQNLMITYTGRDRSLLSPLSVSLRFLGA